MGWMLLITGICTAYYCIGWIFLKDYYDELSCYWIEEDERWWKLFLRGIITLLGLWIFWYIACFFVSILKINYFRVIKDVGGLSDKEGIIFTSGKIYYNIPEYKRHGYINIPVDDMNTRQLDLAVTKLKAWGEKEKLKQARINAYESLDV